jgi:predicted ATPase/DNA-binding CsgD family transcriptional regulator
MSPTNMPIQLSSFIGRRGELAEVERLLSISRLVTLSGPGGCGKTRLAVQAAGKMRDSFKDGVWWVELTVLHDPTLLEQFVTKTLGIPQAREGTALEPLLDHLQSKEVLLVLDNCEHLVADCARLVQQILAASPESRILATSRESLSIPGERIIPLPGLALPAEDAELASSPQELMQYDAVCLFVKRARAVAPNFSITPDNAVSIVQICRRLDGLPLALELASARANVLTIQQIADRLNDRFSLLVSRQRSAQDPRHQTLRAAFDWDYDLLTPPERVMLRRLSVFEGGCSLTTVEAVCSGEEVERGQVLELLSSLVNKSLVVAQTLQRGEARYNSLETIREYAQEKLAASGEWAAIHDRHLHCFLQLMEETATKLSGQYQQLWLNWLEGEYDNVRAALNWALESNSCEAGLRIAIAIYQFWTIRDYVEEGLTWIERLLKRADESIPPAVRANALAYAAFLAGFRGNVAAQMEYGRRAAVLAEAAGEQGKPALRWALAAQAYGAQAANDFQSEYDLGERVIQLNREAGDRYQLGVTLYVYSAPAMALGKYEAARAMLDESLGLLREVGNPYRVAMVLNYTGDLRRCMQDYAGAVTAYEESASHMREIGALRDLASVLHNLGHACLHLGDRDSARALYRESLAIQQVQGNRPGMTECLVGFAALAVAYENPAAAVRLLAAAASLGGQQITTKWAATKMEYEHNLALAGLKLTESEFQAEQEAGCKLSLEQAIETAQSLLLDPKATPASRESPDELTHREREIAELIARGKSNGEIADELVVSKRTIEKHIANIRSKLGFSQRTHIVRWAFETGLVKAGE